ncbi:solute carrier organic anion transporter family member 1C1-like isoform X1 [Solea senegalensis]|uniref:Solute carrier organic anion transporter family member n=2 Tax=Solea senegalensis TaxID=28829 RepID=A0AAV6SZD3_SOLSE|nr:solute carrier organic anion transporter family member 1C1-like isoform X1 [Solea senegalensis]XP_043892194.1 solute carrier organic anion transporter family member 1C1-like isoform X1 [Solea senegalensis]KAG7522502.1 solute carrier organic anion transporter family member 1C1-like isoform X1 [Solea senegalensis]
MEKKESSATGSWPLDNSHISSAVKNSCHPNLKTFLAALSFASFAQALSGSYMKSTITQLERRFDISSYLIGIIDGSFEVGNLLVIAFVSYFGAKLHRPKIISVGCILMSFGTFLMAMPHFISGRYKIETAIRSSVNSTNNLSPCPVSSAESSSVGDRPSLLPPNGCVRESSVSMLAYMFLGNVLRGIGETPIQPLGISYIDDYAESKNAALYIGCVQTISIIGPVFGYLLGSLCAKIYVDIGYMDMETVTITPSDARWVGAWWLGYIIAGIITLMTAVPFWFLPKSLPMPVDKHDASCTPEQSRFLKDSPNMKHKFRPEEPPNLHQMAKEFVPTLKSLLGSPVYIVYLCVTIIQFNSLIGMVTYKPKYIEQHYGQSASKANFLMGMINIPAVALGMFSGGVVMKKFRLGVMGAAKFAFGTSLLGYLLSLFFLAMGCENPKVAGVTVSYTGVEGTSYQEKSLFSDCNSQCSCSGREWDPVCGENGITYASPCLAGCTSSSGSAKNMVFDNCRCLALTMIHSGNMTVTLGQCPRKDDCEKIFPYFLALSVLSSFIISLGGTPGFVLLIRFIKPELKSLALGIHTLATRMLAGIPAPIYFGAIIDTTCLKWGYKLCGGRGACRIYNTSAYRTVYLGLTLVLRTVSFFFCVLGFALLKRHIKRKEKNALISANAEMASLRKEENGSIHCEQVILSTDCSSDSETHL